MSPRVAPPSTAGGALRTGFMLLAALLTVTVTGGFITREAMPNATGPTRALVVLVALTALVLAVRPLFGSWAELGVNRPGTWSRPRLLLLPLVLSLSPLAAGVRHLQPATWAMLTLAYLATGFGEELLWRGVAHRLLEPLGPARGVLLASALFGLAHLGNVLYRDNVALVAAQAWGAFCFGVGYAALRRRTGTIVPLMVLHMLTDLCAAVGAGPAIPFLVAQDVVLLIVGAVLLLADSRAARQEPQEDPGGTVSQRPAVTLG